MLITTGLASELSWDLCWRFCKEAKAICEELFDERSGDLLESLSGAHRIFGAVVIGWYSVGFSRVQQGSVGFSGFPKVPVGFSIIDWFRAALLVTFAG